MARMNEKSHHLPSNLKIVDHSDVVGASPVGAAPTTSSFSINNGFDRLGKDNCKTTRETFKFWDLVGIILESWRYKLDGGQATVC